MKPEFNWTDPEFVSIVLDKLLAVPVLFFVLAVIVIFWFIIRMQGKIIDRALNDKK